MSSLPDISVALGWKPGPVDKELDENVLAKLPSGTKVLSISPSGASAWVQTVRIETVLPDGRQIVYFMKGAPGDRGREMMHGTFESEKMMHTYAPDNVPKPIAWGTYMSMPDTHFYICVFRDMVDDLPGVSKLGALVSKLHLDSMGKSPGGKYGFHVTTHLANVPNDNTWCDTWEEWFTNAMRQMIQAEEKSHGPDDKLKELTDALFAKVIPRLLRPLETGGREIQPCLIHSDLWPGNVKLDAETDQLLIFDSCAYWGHNESDLGPWRAARYRLGRPYMRDYHKRIPKSLPEEDWDDRNLLYAVRYDFLISALFPQDARFREMAMDGVRYLVEKFPNGYQGDETGKSSSSPEIDGGSKLEAGQKDMSV